MAETFKILAINPGSTSTKIGVFDGGKPIFEKTLRHSAEELSEYNRIAQQYEFRKSAILNLLTENQVDIHTLAAIVGRGGLLKPIEGGTYLVEKTMLDDLEKGVQGEHASNLGGIIAYEIAQMIGVRAFIVDPVVVDELQDVARISGMKGIERKSIFHALNQKAVARRYAREKGLDYEDVNVIVAHLGGGISVGAHRKGRVIEVANALDGEAPFSPDRAGGLPVGDVIRLCYSGEYTYEEMKRMIIGNGGLVSYLATNDAIKVCEKIDLGDEYAELIYKAMAYQVSKAIGDCAVALKGKVDAILITGGIAHDNRFTNWIEENVSFISSMYVYPGEDELSALVEGALRVLQGIEKAKEYR